MFNLLIVWCFVLTILSGGEGHRSCSVPTGEAFNKAEYRLRGGNENLSSGDTVSHMTLVFISCKKDFVGDILQRQYTSVCKDGSWSPQLPHCKKFKRCQAPRDIDGAKSSENKNKMVSFPNNYEVTYTCRDGKMLKGSNSVVCLDGKWTDVKFQCVATEVSQPESFCQAPPVDKIVYQPIKDVYFVNESVTFVKCISPRHILDGHNTLTCLENGTWSGHAHCRPTRRCKPVRILRGVVLQRNYRVKALCKSGTTIFPAKLDIRCDDGAWVGKKPACRPTTCLIPQRKQNSLFLDKKTRQVARGRVQTGAIIQQFCKNASPDAVTESKCSRGRWKPKFKNCPFWLSRTRPVSCNIPEYILPLESVDGNFTSFEDRTVRSNQAIVPVCNLDSGLNVTEAEDNPNLQESHCIGGKWIPKLPTCGVKCLPPDGVRVAPIKDAYDVDEEAKIVECVNDEEVLVARSTLQCAASGAWRGEYECYKGTCLPPSDVIVEPSKPSYKVNEEVTVTNCVNKSLRLESKSRITCMSSGIWQGSFECKSDCSARFTRFQGSGYVSRRRVDFVLGEADTFERCQKACVENTNITCTGIEVILEENLLSHCALFQTTRHISEVFTSNEYTARSVYVRGC